MVNFVGGGESNGLFSFRYNRVRDFGTSLKNSSNDTDRGSCHRQLGKWGFSRETLQLHSIRYEYEGREGEDQDMGTADFNNEFHFVYYKGWTEAELRMRKKARMDALLSTMFADSELLTSLSLPSSVSALAEMEKFMSSIKGSLIDVVVQYSTVKATATSLCLFDSLLECPEAVRKPKAYPQGDNSVGAVLIRCGEEDEGGTPEPATSPKAVISNGVSQKISDVFLPNGATVSDLVRAFFLIPTSDAAMSGSPSSRMALYNNVQIWEEIQQSANLYSSQANWGDDCCDEDPCCTAPRLWFNRLMMEERGEFLFHIFWRLVAGGGSMCQWSDQLAAYKVVARELYRDIICVSKRPAALSQIQNRTTTGTTDSLSIHKSSDDVDDGPSEGDKQDTPNMDAFYDLVVQSEVVAVHRVTYVFQVGDETKSFVLPLFPESPSHSNMVPTNISVASCQGTQHKPSPVSVEERMDGNNFCYVTLNPTRQETVVWYHSHPQ